MTPYQINIMLHYHCCVGPWPLYNAPIFEETVNGLVDEGLLQHLHEPQPWCFKTTERGKALVQMWCETPLPEQMWLDPRFAAKP